MSILLHCNHIMVSLLSGDIALVRAAAWDNDRPSCCLFVCIPCNVDFPCTTSHPDCNACHCVQWANQLARPFERSICSAFKMPADFTHFVRNLDTAVLQGHSLAHGPMVIMFVSAKLPSSEINCLFAHGCCPCYEVCRRGDKDLGLALDHGQVLMPFLTRCRASTQIRLAVSSSSTSDMRAQMWL